MAIFNYYLMTAGRALGRLSRCIIDKLRTLSQTQHCTLKNYGCGEGVELEFIDDLYFPKFICRNWWPVDILIGP